MSCPNIAKCYDEIAEDPSMLWLLPEKEWSSLWELPLSGALRFKLISERLFASIASLDMWERPGWNSSPLMAKDQWGSHSYGNLSHRWGRGRKPGHSDILLLPWTSINGGLKCPLCPTSAWLIRAKCGCSEGVYQDPLYPSRDFLFPLSRCKNSFQGYFFHPIPTGLAMSMQATSLFWDQIGPA